jgi:hypothetical protein
LTLRYPIRAKRERCCAGSTQEEQCWHVVTRNVYIHGGRTWGITPYSPYMYIDGAREHGILAPFKPKEQQGDDIPKPAHRGVGQGPAAAVPARSSAEAKSATLLGRAHSNFVLCVHYRLGKRSEDLRCMLRPMTVERGRQAPTG